MGRADLHRVGKPALKFPHVLLFDQAIALAVSPRQPGKGHVLSRAHSQGRAFNRIRNPGNPECPGLSNVVAALAARTLVLGIAALCDPLRTGR